MGFKIPYGYERITNFSYVAKEGDLFVNNGSLIINTIYRFAGKMAGELEKYYDIILIKPIEISKKSKNVVQSENIIPDGYETIKGKTLLKDGDIYWDTVEKQWKEIKHYTFGYPRSMFGDSTDFARKLEKTLTMEEKIKLKIKQSRNFVERNIKNPDEKTYKKFEEVFLREDDFGL